MGVDPGIAGRTYPPAAPYEVGREKIREFAEAVGAAHPAHHDPEAARALGHRDVVAPPTFAVVVAQRAEAAVVQDPASGIDYTRVVHGEQRFVHHRPIVAGDVLTGTLHVDGVTSRGSLTTVTNRVEIADADGAPVTTAHSLIVVRGEEAP